MDPTVQTPNTKSAINMQSKRILNVKFHNMKVKARRHNYICIEN